MKLIALTLTLIALAAGDVAQAHTPAPDVVPPAWAAVLKSKTGGSIKVGRYVCPFGIGAVRVSQASVDLKKKRFPFATGFLNADGVVVVAWTRSERTFVTINPGNYIAAVWCRSFPPAP